jgi:dolichol-phosphate mannosyltransferase
MQAAQTSTTSISTATRPKLGIVTPLANEENNINRLLDAVLEHLAPHDRIYCVLDNVSKDETRNIISGRASEDPRILLVWAPKNRCVVDAYFAGYRAAVDDNCEWILEMDGGWSHLPEEIPRFIAAMSQGYDYVGGSRYLPGGCHKSPFSRRFVSRGGTFLARLALGAKMTDMTSGFECFSRKAMCHILQKGVASRANFFQTEIRWMMHNFRWQEVPIQYANTNFSIGRSSIREAFRILWNMRLAERHVRRAA